MTIQQFTEGSFDEQKVNRHEVRQVLRVLRLSPEGWAEMRRKRAQERMKQATSDKRNMIDGAQ